MPIKALPYDLWMKIAAGEVVERPASAVKELVENSLDAKSKRVSVKLYDGGRLRIIVEDDGTGISFDDLPLALMYHATSKISELEDLEHISTLGYRGEALASLAAVADVEIKSRQKDSESGGLIRSHDGKITEHVKANCSAGTRVQVENLFSGLPARRKFLKSASGELRRAAVYLREYAVCNPDIAFSLEHDGKLIFMTDGGGDKKRVLLKLWGEGAEIQNVNISAEHLNLECWFQSRAGISSSRSDLIAFVNGRAVNDPVIKSAVSQAARELAGNYALFFTLEPSLVDVNIHPSKSEVRFRYPSEIYHAVREAVNHLGSPMPVPEIINTGTQNKTGWNFRDSAEQITGHVNEIFSHPQIMTPNHDMNQDMNQAMNQTPNHFMNLGTSHSMYQNMNQDTNQATNQSTSQNQNQNSNQATNQNMNAKQNHELDLFPEDLTVEHEPEIIYLGQNSGGYLIYDNHEGLVIIDPHAAHERVNYERIKSLAESSMNSQKLFLPVLLHPTLALEANEFLDELNNSGFELVNTPKGIELRAIPAIPECEIESEALLRASLNALKNHHDGDTKNILWRIWATMACKASVKLTTRLTREEALTLWKSLHECEQPYVCPHGRPVMIEIKNADLLKRFGRE